MINAVDSTIGEQIYSHVRYNGRTYCGRASSICVTYALQCVLYAYNEYGRPSRGVTAGVPHPVDCAV
jgi:hypothetical protein